MLPLISPQCNDFAIPRYWILKSGKISFKKVKFTITSFLFKKFMKVIKEKNNYETRVIFSPQASEDDLKTYSLDYARRLYRLGALRVSIVSRGQRDLAYTRKTFKTGHFIEIRFVASPQILPTYRNKLKLDQSIISHVILNLEKI